MAQAFVRKILIGLIRIYRVSISPLIGPRCRYLPTCSDYAAQAIERHGACCGGSLALRRILRCHPWGGSGIDEVPERIEGRCRVPFSFSDRTRKLH